MDKRVNRNKEWTPEDFAKLAALWQAERPLLEICEALGRSPSGVCAQLVNRGYLFYNRASGAYIRNVVFATNRELVLIDKQLAGTLKERK